MIDTKTFCGRQQKQNTSDLIKKSLGISDVFIAANTLQKLPINFTKFNENSIEAMSQQNFDNKAAKVVISSKLSLWSIHFQDLVQKVTKWLIIIHYFGFMLCIAFTLSNNNWHIFIIKFTWCIRSRHIILSHSCSRV